MKTNLWKLIVHGLILSLLFVNSSQNEVLFRCNFDDYSLMNTNICGGTSFTKIGNPSVTALELNQLATDNSIVITDFTSLTNFSDSNACKIPFVYNGVSKNFCTEIDSQFQCEVKSNTYRVCDLGKFLRVRTSAKGEAFSLSFNFETPVSVQPGKYKMSMYTLLNCAKFRCEDAQDTISVKIKDGDSGVYREVYNVKERARDSQWIKEMFQFNVQQNKLFIRLDFSRGRDEGSGDGIGYFFVDQIELERVNVMSVQPPFVCDFDDFSDSQAGICNEIAYSATGQASITGLELDNLPGTSKYITDFTSIKGLTSSSKTCNIPFQINNDTSYFCALKDSQFICEVSQMTFDECNLGEFLRVRSHSRGEALTAVVDFVSPIATIVRKKYRVSLFTLVNCPKVGCEQAKDSISIRIREGDDGVFREVYNVNGRVRDDRWIKEEFTFTATQDKTYVRLQFARLVDQGSGDGLAHFYVDQLQVIEEVTPMKLPFVCDFDKYSELENGICNGITYSTTALSTVTGLEIDRLPGTDRYITDFTSIKGSTVSDKTCNIPFQFNNQESNFCVLKESKFVCEIGQMSYDQCNLGEFLRVKSNSKGEAFTAKVDFKSPMITIVGKRYRVIMYTLINCPKVGCEQGRDTLSVKVKDGDDGVFKEVYLVNNRIRDDRWKKEEFTFTATQALTYIRLEFSRLTDQGARDGVANFYVDQFEINQEFEPVQLPFTCDFDTFGTLESNACKGVSYSTTGQATITSLELDQLPGTDQYITDFTSIAGRTASNKLCNIPFQINNQQSYFCALKDSQFVCEVSLMSYDQCNLGEFLRVKSNLKGEPFTAIFDFSSPLATRVGIRYRMSMFTLIKCAKDGCEQAKDSISVRVRDGNAGVFREVYNVNGRVRDDRWIKEEFTFTATQDKTYVRLQFARLVNQGSGSGLANIYVDQVQIIEDVVTTTATTTRSTTSTITQSSSPSTTTIGAPLNVPFICNFDDYSDLENGVCSGITYSSSIGQATLTGLELDLLPGTTDTYITDFTSIKGLTSSNKSCNIPFQFNNQESNFCVLKDSQFICEVGQMNYDQCNLGEFLRVRSNSQGQAFNLTLDFNRPIVAVPSNRYRMSMFTLINCPKVGCEQGKDSISVRIKNGINGQFTEVYNVNGRSRDNRWVKEEFTFTATQNRIYIRFEFSRSVNQGSGDGVAHIYVDQLELYSVAENTTTTPGIQTTSTTTIGTQTGVTSSNTTSAGPQSTTSSTNPATVTVTVKVKASANIGAIVGGSVGGLVALVIIIVVIVFIVKKKKSKVNMEGY